MYHLKIWKQNMNLLSLRFQRQYFLFGFVFSWGLIPTMPAWNFSLSSEKGSRGFMSLVYDVQLPKPQ